MIDVSDDGVLTTIAIDDGRVNALSLEMQAGIQRGLDEAAEAANAVLLTGRDGRFSAGFDLEVLGVGGQPAVDMVIGGFELARRLLSFDRPVVIACTGHAIAMGAFLLLAADLRVGAAGPHKIAANEVAIGATLPRAALELMRGRLTPAALQRSALLAETFDPDGAVAAGYLDLTAPPDAVVATARELATAAATVLHPEAHRESKCRLREGLLAALDAAIDADRAELATLL